MGLLDWGEGGLLLITVVASGGKRYRVAFWLRRGNQEWHQTRQQG